MQLPYECHIACNILEGEQTAWQVSKIEKIVIIFTTLQSSFYGECAGCICETLKPDDICDRGM